MTRRSLFKFLTALPLVKMFGGVAKSSGTSPKNEFLLRRDLQQMRKDHPISSQTLYHPFKDLRTRYYFHRGFGFAEVLSASKDFKRVVGILPTQIKVSSEDMSRLLGPSTYLFHPTRYIKHRCTDNGKFLIQWFEDPSVAPGSFFLQA